LSAVEKLNHIVSPIPFNKQKNRTPIDLRCAPASEERFSYMPTGAASDLKYRRVLVHDFSKAKAPCIDEFLVE
jgi:hypothetical protein